jgi:hypothetical protein
MQVGRYHPDLTIMAIGANDRFPSGGVQCCGPGWVRNYSAEIRDLARTYGLTYWVLLPLPRSPKLQPGFRAVNRAIRRARPDVETIDLTSVFTPDNRSRPTMSYHGGTRFPVHQRDGVHLSKPAIRIACGVIARRLTRDGFLPRMAAETA